MSATTLLAIIVAVFFLSLCAVETAEAISKKDVKKFVNEYCDPDTSEARRRTILKRLRLASPRALTKPLSKALGQDKRRQHALDLCAKFKVPGLFKQAKKHVDDADSASQAIHAVFVSRDKKAQKFLFDRWEKAATTGDESAFEPINTAYQNHWVGPKTITWFHDLLVKSKLPDDRSKDIQSILKYQMVLNDEDVDRLTTSWKSLYGRFLLRHKPFMVSGKNLLLEDGWNAAEFGYSDEDDLIKRYRDRMLIEPGGVMYMGGLSLTRFKITVMVMVLEGQKETVGLGMKGNALVGASFKGGGWEATISNSADGTGPKNTLPGATHKWQKIVFSNHGGGVLVTVNGTELVKAVADYGTTCKSIRLAAGLRGRLLAAVVDFEK